MNDDYVELESALTHLETIANVVNERKRSIESLNKIMDILNRLVDCPKVAKQELVGSSNSLRELHLSHQTDGFLTKP